MIGPPDVNARTVRAPSGRRASLKPPSTRALERPPTLSAIIGIVHAAGPAGDRPARTSRGRRGAGCRSWRDRRMHRGGIRPIGTEAGDHGLSWSYSPSPSSTRATSDLRRAARHGDAERGRVDAAGSCRRTGDRHPARHCRSFSHPPRSVDCRSPSGDSLIVDGFAETRLAVAHEDQLGHAWAFAIGPSLRAEVEATQEP